VAVLALGGGCGSSIEPHESVAGVAEHFCRYEADSADEEQDCFSTLIDGNTERTMHREEWGPRAQAMIYALGELPGCGSKAGSQCEPATWEVKRSETLVAQRYCAYGSSSAAQFAGCIAHVRPSGIIGDAVGKYAATNADSNAVGDKTDCGYDSGPFCR